MSHATTHPDRDLAADLAAWVAETRFRDLPPDAVASAKVFLLDTLGDAIAGWNAPGCAAVHDLVAEWGGRAESTTWVYGTRAPAPNAAMVNGTLCHAVEFDDVHDRAHVHAFAPVLPATLAMAERHGGVDGRELLTALVLGVDLMCRLGLAIRVERGWHYTLVFGVFGAAAAAGRLLGLGPEALLNALGLAYSRAGGTEQGGGEYRLVKRLHPGFAAQSGVTAALLASRGITGPEHPFEGRLGYYPVYENGVYDRDRVLEGLGSRFEVSNLRIKPYPCCGYNHAAVDATLDIVRAANLQPDEVIEVEVVGPRVMCESMGGPFEVRTNPQADAQFSLPYAVAVAIRKRQLFLDDFEDAAVRDPDTHALAARVRVEVDPRIEERAPAPVTVRVRTTDGRTLEARAEETRGHAGNPLSSEEMELKFRRCLAYARRPEFEARGTRMIQMVQRLEDLADVRDLVALLTPE